MIGRRALLKGGVGLGAGLSVARGNAQGQDTPASARPKEGDWLVKADDTTGRPLTPDDIADASLGGSPTTAWAMDPTDNTVRSGTRLNGLIVLRFDTARLSAETLLRSAGGIVAYTSICTHNGCDVSDWIADEQMLSCPCHFSKFDPRDGAKVVDGPASRGLPALPLKLADGKLSVAGPFTARVGFEAL
jgi:rieske iron-sulfur protein